MLEVYKGHTPEFVRKLRRFDNAHVNLVEPSHHSLTLLTGIPQIIPVQLENIPFHRAKLTYFVSDAVSPSAITVELTQNGLVVKGHQTGKCMVSVFVMDNCFPGLTGDPEEDQPLHLHLEVV